MKILLVEDDRFSQLVTEVALRNIGASFTTVSNGDEALKVLGADVAQYQYVLMDFRMPDMDGFDVTRKIRQHSDARVRDIPVIGLSGSKSFSDQRKAMAAGMNLCISKPVSAAMLKRVLLESSAESTNLPEGAIIASPPRSSVVLDMRTLKYLADETDVHVVKKVVQSFLKNLPIYVDQICQGLAQERDELIHRYAHILRSSSGTVGAEALFELACELESISSQNHRRDLFSLVTKTKAASESVVFELTRYLDEVSAADPVVVSL